MPGPVEDLGRGARLDDLAPLHDRHPVGQIGDNTHVVGDEQDPGVDAVAEVAHEVEDLGLHRDVERGRRLVGDQEPRIERQRLGDHRPLPLPSRQLVRVGVEAALGIRDLHQLEQFDRPLVGGAGRHRLMAAEHLGDLEADRVDGIERGHRLLEDHRDLAPADRPHHALIDAGQLDPVELDRAPDVRVLRQQAHQRERRRRLARARLADDRQHFARAEVERGVDDCRVPDAVDPEVDVEVLDA